MFKKIKLVTHDGTFHADEIFTTALFKILYKGKIKVTRSRDKGVIEKADIVYDIGGVYDHESKRYDHHQDGAPVRDNGIPYSAFGLTWKHYGSQLVSNSEIQEKVDEEFVQQICAADTGAVSAFYRDMDWEVWTLNRVFKLFRPERGGTADDMEEKFFELVDISEKILVNLFKKYENWCADSKIVEKAYEEAEDKRVVVLDKGCSWRDAITKYTEPIFVVYYNENKDVYDVIGVPIKKGSMEVKVRFPEGWGGKDKEELKKISGNPGIDFCHKSGFMAVFETLDSALESTNSLLDK